MLLLFPAMPGMVREPDPDFQAQTEAAAAAGLPLALLDFEALLAREAGRALRRTPPGDGALAVYRGWMLDPAVCALLHAVLAERGWRLINSPAECERCHHFPGTAAHIARHAPCAVWSMGVPDLDEIMARLAPFGDAPLVLKDWAPHPSSASKAYDLPPKRSHISDSPLYWRPQPLYQLKNCDR